MKKKEEKEEKIIRLVFYFLFGILGAFVLLTPHLIMGHVFIPEKYAQSLTLFAEMVIGYLFYIFYRRKMKNLHDEKVQAEKRLTNSYGYIGKANNIIDIFKKFGRFFPENKQDLKTNEIFNALLANILVSVAKSDKGFLRFIDTKTGRTIKEFYFSGDTTDWKAKISNSAVLGKKDIGSDGLTVIESDYGNSGICCILCIPDTKKIDVELVKSLVNQMHLLYLAVYEK